MKLVPLIDNFEAAKNAIKVQSDSEQKIVDSYQVSAHAITLPLPSHYRAITIPYYSVIAILTSISHLRPRALFATVSELLTTRLRNHDVSSTWCDGMLYVLL